MQTGTALMMTPDEVAARLQVSRRSLDRYVKAGNFPAPVRFGRLVRWHTRTVDQYLERAAQTAMEGEEPPKAKPVPRVRKRRRALQ